MGGGRQTGRAIPRTTPASRLSLKSSQIGAPDMVMPAAEPYTHSGDMTDQYQVFVLPADPDNFDLAIRALEVGNRTGVAPHRLGVGCRAGTAVNLDAQGPRTWVRGFGGWLLRREQLLWRMGPWGFDTRVSSRRRWTCRSAGADLLNATGLTIEKPISPVFFFAEEPIEREVGAMGPRHPAEVLFPPRQPRAHVSRHHGRGRRPEFAQRGSTLPPHRRLSWEVFCDLAEQPRHHPAHSIPSWDFSAARASSRSPADQDPRGASLSRLTTTQVRTHSTPMIHPKRHVRQKAPPTRCLLLRLCPLRGRRRAHPLRPLRRRPLCG